MSEISLYVDYLSQPSRAVLSFCKMFDLTVKVIKINLMKGEFLSENFRKISPAQTVPTLVHGKLVLYESHAIIIYLAGIFNIQDPWYPSNAVERSLVDCYLHWHHFFIRFGCGVYLQHLFIFKRVYGKTFDEIGEMTNQYRDDAFAMIEGILAKGQYVARTSKPSIADICCYCELISLKKFINYDFEKYQFIPKWMEEIGKLKGVEEVHLAFLNSFPKEKI